MIGRNLTGGSTRHQSQSAGDRALAHIFRRSAVYDGWPRTDPGGACGRKFVEASGTPAANSSNCSSRTKCANHFAAAKRKCYKIQGANSAGGDHGQSQRRFTARSAKIWAARNSGPGGSSGASSVLGRTSRHYRQRAAIGMHAHISRHLGR